MVGDDDWSLSIIAFVIARLIGGLFGGTAATLGEETTDDLYLLHQRGKGLAVLNISFPSSVVVGQTLSGYISRSGPWTVQLWWSNGLEAAIIVLSLGFLEYTYYYRGSKAESIVLYLRRIFREKLDNVLLKTSDCTKSIK